jgi:mono/diheme cytochrome c family protein
VLLGCAPDGTGRGRGSPVTTDAGDAGSDAAPGFCARAGDDVVRDLFCGGVGPEISGLADLENRLGLGMSSLDGGVQGGYAPAAKGTGIDFRLAFLDHSTSLSEALVSPINPRALLVGTNRFLAFTRGLQEVEIVATDRTSQSRNFYLVSFEQACNAKKGGCGSGDLFTPRIESEWKRVAIKDAEDLKNSPQDCRQCHERGLPAPILLMREFFAPWTHFFGPIQLDVPNALEATGFDLVRDYVAAKNDEGYAGIASGTLQVTAGISLQNAVDVYQPVVFDGFAIVNERWRSGPNGYPTTPQRSPTWYAAYEGFKRGENLPLPYFEPRPTDPTKQAALTAAYTKYRSGELAAEDLPDLSDIFPDDPRTRAEIGLQTEPGATPAQALVQACGACHNDVLDQSISRARFNIDLARMDRAELTLAIARLTAPHGADGSMPPPGRRQVDAAGVDALVAYLKDDVRSADDDLLLARAAKLGMAGSVIAYSELPDPSETPTPDQ